MYQNISLINSILEQKKHLEKTIPSLAPYFVTLTNDQRTLPFLPIRAFRDFPLSQQNTATGERSDRTVFFSSGSTNSVRAQHSFSAAGLEIYRKNSVAGFAQFLQDNNFSRQSLIISLIPSPAQWPNSSLAKMIEMFATSDFSVLWCPVEEHPENLFHLLETVKKDDEVLIFGTTFHHLIISSYAQKEGKNINFPGKKIGLIDTGGTKGRTLSLDPKAAQTIIKAPYQQEKEIFFFSEYGMCELASQAWSLKPQHDGSFICNHSLHPVAICLKTYRILPHGEKGFLGFIDEGNKESFSALITEDYGFTFEHQGRTGFTLLGRAPDATIKGCSLNVRANFFFLPQFKETNQNELDEKGTKKAENIDSLLKHLDASLWFPSAQHDLQLSLSSLPEVPLAPQKELAGKNILIIASANIPITWLYPTFTAALHGARSVTIKLPSTRNNDPLASLIRKQIKNLAQQLTLLLSPLELFFKEEFILKDDIAAFDTILVFGTDETIQHFQKEAAAFPHLKLLPLGNITNSFAVDTKKNSPEYVAALCSTWFGRGCLTPHILFLENALEKNLWIEDFHNSLEEKLQIRFQEAQAPQDFCHDHNFLFVRSKLAELGADTKRIMRKQLSVIVDLRGLERAEIEKIDPSFSFSGSGFVYILDKKERENFPHLWQENPRPNFLDVHQGKTWKDWFLQ